MLLKRIVLGALACVALLLPLPRAARADDTTSRPIDERTTLRGVVWAGGQLGRVFGLTTHSLQLGAGLETRGRSLNVLVAPELDLGQTAQGLTSRRLALTIALESPPVGPVVFGIGVLHVFDWLGDGHAIGIGLTMHAHVDVLRLGDDRALFLLARGDATTMHGLGGAGENPAVLTASAGLGLRF